MRSAARKGLAVGFFDGVHRGHRAILERAASALTFRNHPLDVLAPARAPRLIMPFDARLAAIRACGVPHVTALEFTPALAATPAEAFLRDLLALPGAADGIFCGDDWRFGRGGEGDAAFLRAHGVAVHVLPRVEHAGGRISSTRVRAALEAGDPAEAAAMLGRAWSVRGETVKGKGLGGALGFPTVNLRLNDLRLLLPRGVYVVEALGRRAIANFGVAPTMGAEAWSAPVLEVHFSDGEPVDAPAAFDVSFLRYLRAERTFPSTAALVAQIRDDLRAMNA